MRLYVTGNHNYWIKYVRYKSIFFRKNIFTIYSARSVRGLGKIKQSKMQVPFELYPYRGITSERLQFMIYSGMIIQT